MRRIAQRVFIDHTGILEELLDQGERNRLDRIFQRGFADVRTKRALAMGDAIAGNDQLIARIDLVRMAHLLVQMPDFRPMPWLDQEFGGNVPQGIALLDDVPLRSVIGPLLRGEHRNREQEPGRNRK